MFKKIKRETTDFNLFLLEAEDDETNVSVTVAPRKNRGTDYSSDSDEDSPATTEVTVSPRKNRGTDYSSDTDDEPEETADEAEDEPADTGADEPAPSDDDGTDYTADSEENTEVNEEPSDNEEDTGDADESTDDESTDYTASAEDTDGDEEEGTGEETTETDDESGDTGTASDKNKKYSMYKKFMSLHSRLNDFVDELEGIETISEDEYNVIKSVGNNLRDLNSVIYDYMVLRYKNSSYIQTIVMYERFLATVRLNFSLLANFKTLL